jgi:WD40 repeat protein
VAADDGEDASSTAPPSPRTRKHARDSTNGLVHDGPSAPKRSRRSHGSSTATANGHVAETDPHGETDSRAGDVATAAGSATPGDDDDGDMMDVDGEADADVDVDADADADAEADGAEADGETVTTAAAATAADEGVPGAASAATASTATTPGAAPPPMANHVAPPPVPAAPTPTLANGRSVGVQSDKVAELGPETSVWSLPGANLTHASWNPHDSSVLATGGRALCRIWSLSTAALRDPGGAPRPRPFVDLQDPAEATAAAAAAAMVTSMAWSPDGESLAVAMYHPGPHPRGSISIRTKAGDAMDELPGGQEWVLNLRWNGSGSRLFAVTHSDITDSTLMVWDMVSGLPIEPLETSRTIFDGAWLGESDFAVCGAGLIARSSLRDRAIEPLQLTALDDAREWSKIRHCPITRTTAVVAESSGGLAILDAAGRLHITQAHEAEITALAYQPLANPSAHRPSAPRLLATASSDGTIKIWDAQQPFALVHTLALGRAAPALAMSFTADGYLVAAASWNRILFWNAETGGPPKATWTGKDGEWHAVDALPTNGDLDDHDDGPVHSLSWDADGGKLAYGLRDQVRAHPRADPPVADPADCHHQLPTATAGVTATDRRTGRAGCNNVSQGTLVVYTVDGHWIGTVDSFGEARGVSGLHRRHACFARQDGAWRWLPRMGGDERRRRDNGGRSGRHPGPMYDDVAQDRARASALSRPGSGRYGAGGGNRWASDEMAAHMARGMS